MKVSIRRNNHIYIIFFIIFLLQSVDNVLRELRFEGYFVNSIKNVLYAVLIYIAIWNLYRIKRERAYKSIFNDELQNIIFLTGWFTVLSLYYMIKNNGFRMLTVEGLIRLLIPVFVAYVMLNVLSMEEIYNLMSTFLIIMFFFYLWSKWDRFTIENIRSISFLRSASPFESNHFSPAAIGFCLFFCYYRKNRFLTLLSVFFVLMTFKRIMILYAIFLLLFGGEIKKRQSMPKWVIYVFDAVFFLLSLLYIQLMLGEYNDLIYKITGMHIVEITMGRSYFMQRILADFKSLGFMSSNTLRLSSMEMDMPMVYVEMGIFAVAATVYHLSNLVKQNWYQFFVVIFCLLEILTSHWFDIIYFWILFYVTIGCITYKKEL